jgi:transcriptional regulatory protein LevR
MFVIQHVWCYLEMQMLNNLDLPMTLTSKVTVETVEITFASKNLGVSVLVLLLMGKRTN